MTRIRFTTYSKVELEDAYTFLTDAARIASSVDLDNLQEFDVNPGKHCHFCNAKPICDSYKEEYLSPVVHVENGLTEVSELQDEQISKLINHKSQIEKYLKDAVEYALKRGKEGNPVPGTKLVQGRGRRFWGNEKKMIEEVTKLGVDPFQKPKVKALTNIERELKKVMDPMEMEVLIDNLTGYKRGNIQVVPASDKRKELTIDPLTKGTNDEQKK